MLQPEEVDLEDDSGHNLKKRLSLEPNVQKLDNNPTNIIKFARLLQKHEFKQVEVTKSKSDLLKNQPGHHKAKAHDIAKIGVIKTAGNHEEHELRILDESVITHNSGSSIQKQFTMDDALKRDETPYFKFPFDTL